MATQNLTNRRFTDLSANNNKLVDVDNGSADNDAINVSQLNAVRTSATELTFPDGSTFTGGSGGGAGRYDLETSGTHEFYEPTATYVASSTGVTNNGVVDSTFSTGLGDIETDTDKWRGAVVRLFDSIFIDIDTDTVQASNNQIYAETRTDAITTPNPNGYTGYFILAGLSTAQREYLIENGQSTSDGHVRLMLHAEVREAQFVGTVSDNQTVNGDGTGGALESADGTGRVRLQIINQISDSTIRVYPISSTNFITGFQLAVPGADLTEGTIQIGRLIDVLNISNRIESLTFQEESVRIDLSVLSWVISPSSPSEAEVAFATSDEAIAFVSLMVDGYNNETTNQTTDNTVTFFTTINGVQRFTVIEAGSTVHKVSAVAGNVQIPLVNLFQTGDDNTPTPLPAVMGSSYTVSYSTSTRISSPVNGSVVFRGFGFEILPDGTQLATPQGGPASTNNVTIHTNISLGTPSGNADAWAVDAGNNRTQIHLDQLNEGDVATGLQTDIDKFLTAFGIGPNDANPNVSNVADLTEREVIVNFNGQSVTIPVQTPITAQQPTPSQSPFFTLTGVFNLGGNVDNNPRPGEDIQIESVVNNAIFEAGSNLQITLTGGNIVEIASTEADIEVGTRLPGGANHLDIFALTDTYTQGQTTFGSGSYVWIVESDDTATDILQGSTYIITEPISIVDNPTGDWSSVGGPRNARRGNRFTATDGSSSTGTDIGDISDFGDAGLFISEGWVQVSNLGGGSDTFAGLDDTVVARDGDQAFTISSAGTRFDFIRRRVTLTVDSTVSDAIFNELRVGETMTMAYEASTEADLTINTGRFGVIAGINSSSRLITIHANERLAELGAGVAGVRGVSTVPTTGDNRITTFTALAATITENDFLQYRTIDDEEVIENVTRPRFLDPIADHEAATKEYVDVTPAPSVDDTNSTDPKYFATVTLAEYNAISTVNNVDSPDTDDDLYDANYTITEYTITDDSATGSASGLVTQGGTQNISGVKTFTNGANFSGGTTDFTGTTVVGIQTEHLPTDLATTDTAQDITGVKDFTNGATFSGGTTDFTGTSIVGIADTHLPDDLVYTDTAQDITATKTATVNQNFNDDITLGPNSNIVLDTTSEVTLGAGGQNLLPRQGTWAPTFLNAAGAVNLTSQTQWWRQGNLVTLHGTIGFNTHTNNNFAELETDSFPFPHTAGFNGNFFVDYTSLQWGGTIGGGANNHAEANFFGTLNNNARMTYNEVQDDELHFQIIYQTNSNVLNATATETT